MKKNKLKTALAACTGRAILYCYRSYTAVFKDNGSYTVLETKPGQTHIRFTSAQFKAPCQN